MGGREKAHLRIEAQLLWTTSWLNDVETHMTASIREDRKEIKITKDQNHRHPSCNCKGGKDPMGQGARAWELISREAAR